ncbi:ATP-binding protein [Actinacidiphila epipremni]|uniref:histidine kinase n=1 Tax=Actinacidiphila epipremni TaxID=2053013 RepID=A0ABX0ZQI7_9ACTN|nr:sensor histidine kinase [Actinacidiphila epipremni]NJP46204.1 sensor histidine kinase [Actinacidiphila epipremni]
MSTHISGTVFWPVAVVAVALLALWIRQAVVSAALRRRLAQAVEDVRAREAELGHLVDVRLPAVEMAGRRPPQGLRDQRLAGSAYADRLDQVVHRFVGASEKARVRADHAAKSTLMAAMKSVQALANEQQLAITEMQNRHHSAHVLQDLMEIDHANSQFARRAQAVAVLCGSWPGRQRAASPLIDVLRGAKSRIRDYQRVEIYPGPEVDVISRAVEPVVLTVAELLDNATRHSQPNTSVEVTIRPAHNGTTIVIDDAGVGMDELEISTAVERLTRGQHLDINALGDPPQFGFAAVGVLAARYGFTVSVDTQSPYGGVRAVIFLPKALLVAAGQGAVPVVARAAAHDRAVAQARQQGGATPMPVRTPGAARPTAAPDPQPAQAAAPAAPAAPAPAATPPAAAPAAGPVPLHAPAPEPAPVPAPLRPLTPVATPATPTAPADADLPAHERDDGYEVPETPITGITAGGLPKRRRREISEEQLAARYASASGPAVGEDTGPVRTAQETASRMGAFARGTRSGRAESADVEGTAQQ